MLNSLFEKKEINTGMKKDITELYSFIDDFCKIYYEYEKKKLLPTAKQRNRRCDMSLSEIMTIMVMYNTSYAKNFKYFYKTCIEYIHKGDFPKALSYNRFVELMPRLFVPLNILMHLLFGEETGSYFIDATTINACHNKRRYSNKIFKGLAKHSKSSMGYFYGFKLHLIINEKGQFIALKMTKGNVDDRISVPELTDGLTGVMYADKGYIKQNLFVSLYERGLKMVHGIKKNMPNKLMDLKEKIMLRKRNLIETVFDYLKNKMNLEHTRHRSPINAFVHILSTLVAYSLKKNKPSINCNLDFPLNYNLIPN
ncbi:IS982 family transposase [Candidatus Tisiphia endosymbiont of Dioctria rufipes]|uniref:IS982 family transposase n=2 Tax=Candidatus Tisiphia endosymbiont of Dioctria rufipes TaxID=3066255 RepID=UPI00397772AF